MADLTGQPLPDLGRYAKPPRRDLVDRLRELRDLDLDRTAIASVDPDSFLTRSHDDRNSTPTDRRPKKMSAWRDDHFDRGPEPLVYTAADIEPDTDLRDVLEATSRNAADRVRYWQDRAARAEALLDPDLDLD